MVFTFLTSISSHYRVMIPVIALFTGVFFQDILQYYYGKYIKNHHANSDGTISFSVENLARYNGVIEENLYMAVLGIVYDVSDGSQHYAMGSPYHYFVGKDGCRALVTGDFKDESENKDHVLDLSCNDILSLLQWRESLEKKYKQIGILAGRYYEGNGRSTPYRNKFNRRIKECFKEKELSKQESLKYPPCNIAWSEQEGTKVWCTKTSGGSHRDWTGVPRQLFTPGETKPRCVCVNTDKEQDASVKFKEYENCGNTSAICFVSAS